jgi:hypothetical protein
MTRRRPRPELASRICRNENCRDEFRPDRPSQVFCTVQCRNAAKARGRRSNRLAEISRLQARVAELEAKLAELAGGKP